ncbi:6-carboxytetrahydropterin synthase QueD [Cognatishimia sp.]|uniref:6-carboxytetrahydropterin synthase QueD n=1 Tax=Cognatishimia sp. TaxID=2211648 RepID=UPI00351454D6
MYRIGKEFYFSASHQLKGLPEGHPCTNLHGHNYIVTLELASADLDEVGFIVDFKELDALKHWIDTTLDHKHLNDVFEVDNVSTEWLCKVIYDWCKERWSQTSAVKIQETPKIWAEYRP